MRALLIEDEREVRTVLRIGLAVYGLTVVGEADTAESGAELARMLNPNLIVLDLRLPDSDRRATFDAVRGAAPASRLVIYTARESGRRWYEQQGAAFFGKTGDRLDQLLDWCRAEAERP